MTRMPALFVALVCVLLLPGLGESVAAQDTMPPWGSVWTVYTTVEAEIVDDYAVVQVIADIGNRGPDPEFPFLVQVPAGAYVTGLTIERDGELHEARIEEREAAREEYEQHKSIEETGGLVEKQRGHDVYAYLINVAEFTSVQARLTYEVALAAEAGVYSLPMEAPVSGFGQDLGAAFHVTVEHSDGLVAAWSSPGIQSREPEAGVRSFDYSVGARPSDDPTPFSVHYTLPSTGNAGSVLANVIDGEGYFIHRFRAPVDGERLPLDLVLIMDTSGSMSGAKIDQLRDAGRQLVGMLGPNDRLSIVPFSTTPRPAWDGMLSVTDEVRNQSLEAVDDFIATGGTNIHDAIEVGFEQLGSGQTTASEDTVPIVIFLTDGLGKKSPDVLRDVGRSENTMEARVFGVAFGTDADWSLVAGLAQDGGGHATRVDEGAGAEVDLLDFMSALTAPVLRDVAIDYQGDVTPYVVSGDVLFAGSELLVVGTFDSKVDPFEATVTAVTVDGPRSYTVSEPVDHTEARWLPRLVTAHRIASLEAEIAAEGEDDELVQEIMELATDFGFVTDYTSLVLTLDHADPTACWDWCGDDCANCDRVAGEGGRAFAFADAAPEPRSRGGVPDRADSDAPMDPSDDGDDSWPSRPGDDSSEKESPGIGLVVLIAALGAIAVARRRQ